MIALQGYIPPGGVKIWINPTRNKTDPNNLQLIWEICNPMKLIESFILSSCYNELVKGKMEAFEPRNYSCLLRTIKNSSKYILAVSLKLEVDH